MPSIAELEDALVNADKAGDTNAARQLADALHAMQTKAKPAEQHDEGASITDSMSTTEKVLAGAGKGFADVGRSLGQGVRWLSPKVADAIGAPTQADIDDSKRRDEALMNTTAGLIGNIGGNVAMGFMPGTGQIGAAKKINDLWNAGGALTKIAALGGAAGMGAAQNVAFNPRSKEESLGGQVAMGGAMGAAGQLVGPALAATVQGVRNIKAGSMGTVGRTLADFANMPPEELAKLIRSGNTQLVAGSMPTTVQASQVPGVARLKSAISSMYPNEFAGVDATQNAARVKAVDKVAPGASGRTSIDAAENAGDVLKQEAAAHRDTFKGLVSEQYNHPSLDTAAIALPDKDSAMAILNKFYPGQALGADDSSRALAAFTKRLDSGEPIPLKEFDALRKIAGNKAVDMGDTDRTAAAAWGSLKGLFNDAESAAIAKSADKFAVTGQGPHGPIYGNLSGDADNTVAHLLRMRQGEVPGALTHKDVPSPMDLVWGKPGTGSNDGYGVSKLERFHPEALPDLQGLINDLSINPGKSGPNRLVLDNVANDRGVVSLNYQGDPKTWLLSAFRKSESPAEGALHGASKTIDTAGITGRGDHPSTTMPSIDDIVGSFKAFDQSLQPPGALRDPRQYVGGLLAPDQAHHLQTGRQLHGELKDRFNTGPSSLLWKTGSDGAPRLQGAEAIKAFVNGKDSQVADIAQLRNMVLDKGPTMQAAKGYAISDLLQSATNTQGELLPSKFGNWIDRRSGMLDGLLNNGDQATISNVNQDLQRASSADAMERVRGQSNTAEKLTSLGLLDNGLTDMAVKFLSHLPAVGGMVGAGASGGKEAIKRWKYRDLPGALIDPEQAIAALQKQMELGELTSVQKGALSQYLQQLAVPALTSDDANTGQRN